MTSRIQLARVALAGAAICTMPAGAAERTTFSLRTYVEHDDNVALVADAAFAAEPVSSAGVGLMLNVGRTFYRTATFDLRGSVSVFHTQQLNRDAEGFDVSGVVPRLALTKHTSFLGKPSTVLASVNLRRDWLGGETYSQLIDLGGSWMVNVTPGWSIGPGYVISSRDYDDEGFDPEITSRNALRHTLGVNSQWQLPSPVGARAPARLTVSVSAQRNDADGRNFEFAGAVYGAQFDLPLTARTATAFGNLGLQLSVSSMDVDYDDFAVLPKRSDQRLTASVSVSATLRPLGNLDLSFTHLDIDSTRPEYESSRNLLRFGITHSF